MDARPDWTGQLRRTNATRRLLKHDCVYQWERDLSTIGLESPRQLLDRKSQLAGIADAAMSKVLA
jgi:hypothetical protein